jgi:hypothetical protein
MTDPQTLTLIVPNAEVMTGEPESKPEDFEEQAFPKFLARLVHRPKEVDLNTLQDGLQTVQGQIDALLKVVKDSTVDDYRLNSVEVSLGISAEGSIGVATAGVEASISLSFERVG